MLCPRFSLAIKTLKNVFFVLLHFHLDFYTGFRFNGIISGVILMKMSNLLKYSYLNAIVRPMTRVMAMGCILSFLTHCRLPVMGLRRLPAG